MSAESFGAQRQGILSFDHRTNGVVYTPANLAEYLSTKTFSFILRDYLSALGAGDPETESLKAGLRILDPACGDGELLLAAWRQLNDQLQLPAFSSLRQKLGAVSLYGIDIDPEAAHQTKQRIELFAGECASTILTGNSLYPSTGKTSAEGWITLLKQFNCKDGFDVIIANPPWGADVRDIKESLQQKDFTLFKGQFDSSDLFMELALRLLKPNGYLAFIVPDSLFTQERITLRKLLLDQTEIRFVARMGERIFENINRACVLVICKKSVEPKTSAKTQCLRLTPSIRRHILDGNMSFLEADKILSHDVFQQRFLENQDYRFDIDTVSREQKTLASINAQTARFKNFLENGRGIELSKTGRVYQCEHCDNWLPFPGNPHPKCPHCKSGLSLLPGRIDTIVYSDPKQEGCSKLLVGESIQRYGIVSPLWIDTGRVGINYKPSATYQSPKLLVRKTGVGISAAIDYSDSYTNQVVYIFRTKANLASPALEFFLAILNSRAMYYYLIKNHGETEWRSHPYLTQKQILDLPCPDDHALTNGSGNLVREVVDLIRPYTTQNLIVPDDVDARVERLIGKLYGLGKKDYQIIYKAIDAAQALLPVRRLRRVSLADIFC